MWQCGIGKNETKLYAAGAGLGHNNSKISMFKNCKSFYWSLTKEVQEILSDLNRSHIEEKRREGGVIRS